MTDTTPPQTGGPGGPAIEDYLLEDRTFPPTEAFRATALVAGTSLHDEANQDFEGFWARQAADLLTWQRDWDQILDWQRPDARWFVGGKLNWDFKNPDAASHDLKATISAGFTLKSDDLGFGVQATWDGVGSGGYEGISGKLTFSHAF